MPRTRRRRGWVYLARHDRRTRSLRRQVDFVETTTRTGCHQAQVVANLGEFDGVVGTSIGAINGAIYLEGGYSKLFDVWNEIQTNTVFDLQYASSAARD